MTAKHLKVASSQYPIGQPKTLAEWEKKIALWVKNGAATGAELLVFPEYAAIEQAACFGPEIYEDLQATLTKVAELKESRVQFHLELAAKHNVHILVGSGPTKKIDGRFVNAAQLVTPKGSVGEQEKLVMTPFEHGWGVTRRPGARLLDITRQHRRRHLLRQRISPHRAGNGGSGSGSVARSLMHGAGVRISPRSHRLDGARARETIAAVQSPTVGDAPWSPAVDFNAGAAGVYVPSEHDVSDTGVLAQGTLNAAEWVTASIDLARLARVRETGEMHDYGDWLKQPGGGTTAKVDVEVVKLI